jgi:hypothetical protein
VGPRDKRMMDSENVTLCGSVVMKCETGPRRKQAAFIEGFHPRTMAAARLSTAAAVLGPNHERVSPDGRHAIGSGRPANRL